MHPRARLTLSGRYATVLLLTLTVLSFSCGRAEPTAPPAPDTSPSTRQPAVNPAPEPSGVWIRPKHYASTRFSELDQITSATVRRLGLKFTFSTGVVRGHEAAPLVVNGTMYIVTPFQTRSTPWTCWLPARR
jgi:glucose dehydrogenase